MFLLFLFTYMNENMNSYVVLGGDIKQFSTLFLLLLSTTWAGICKLYLHKCYILHYKHIALQRLFYITVT